MKIKDIARIKGREVITVKPGTSLSEAINLLVSHNIGALPVCETVGKVSGILSERDVLKCIHRTGAEIRNTKVKDIMTRSIVVGDPEDELEGVLIRMSEKGVRHLPIIHDNNIVGILSLRDVIEEQLSECNNKIETLHDYISGGLK